MANRLKSDKTKKKSNPEKLILEKEETVQMRTLIRDERTHKIIGAVLLLLSFFLLVAFTSYLFTWSQDQDKVFSHGIGILKPNDLQIANLLGSFGAYISHLFFYKGFGVASFLFCTTFFIIGSNLLFARKIFSVRRHLKYLVVGLLVLSVSFAFFANELDATFHWGGAMGNVMSKWLSGFIGKIGTGALLLVAVLSYVIWRFNPVFNVPKIPKFSLPVREKKEAGSNVTDEPVLLVEESLLEKGKKGNKLKGGTLATPASIVEEEEEIAGEGEAMPELKLMEKPIHEEWMPKAGPASEQPPFPLDPSPVAEKPLVRAKQSTLPASDLQLEIKAGGDGPKPEVEEGSAAKVAKLPPYDPILDLRDYKFPTLDLLEVYGTEKIVTDPAELETNKNQIINTLRNYDIEIQKIFATVGPTVTLYEIVPAAGVRISRIKNLEDDIALSLSALGIRIIAPIPGKGTIGIEVPNVKKSIVSMRTMLASEKFQNNHFALPVALGKKIDNELFVVDLTTMPHLLMAGATGQGKSVGVNAILVSLLYKKHPSQLKFVLVDPKKVELSLYRAIEKHFLAKLPGEEEAIITDTKKVVNTLNALCIEMDTRYDLLKEAGCRNIREYNEKFVARKLNPEKGHQFLPFIVLVIDEFADLIMTAGKEIEMPIARLAQLARAVGIHLIIATQRPSVNIITGTIKANFPARIAFKVSSKVDSRTIIDTGGAEQLIGRGDMLISYNGELTRLQCVFVDTPEVENVVECIAAQRGYPQAFLLPEYVDEKELEGRDVDLANRDPLFEDAARLVVASQIGSTSLLQRRMKLGYNRAGRLMDQLESAGIVGPSQGSKARDVLYKTEMDLEAYLQSLD
jgi:DNA segregation ATPase FtsK/SpoIIIE, S-DNA-T family